MKTSPDALLLTAFRLFLTQGYKETSMQDLARASGLSKGAFHHYFPRKQDILDACLKRFFIDYLPDTEAAPDQDATTFARDAARKYAQVLAFMVEQNIPLCAYQAFMWSQMRDAPEVFVSRQIAVIKRLSDGFDRLNPGHGHEMAQRFFAMTEGTAVFLSLTPPTDPHAITQALEVMLDDFFDSALPERNRT